MELDTTTIIVAIIGSGVLNTAVSFLLSKIDKRSGLERAIRLVMKDRIRYICLKHISQNWIYEDELEDLLVFHKSYHDDAHGNGYLDDLISKVRHLEIRVRG